MVEDNRLTFEGAYKNTVANSQLYELKNNCPSASIPRIKEVSAHDNHTLHQLIDDLCEDMTFLFKRKFKRIWEVNLSRQIDERFYPHNLLDTYVNTYETQMSRRISQSLHTIVPQPGTICGTPHIGWIKWRGTDANIQFFIDSDQGVDIQDADMQPLGKHQPSARIQKILNKLKKTKLNYDPYVLVGTNGKRFLAIRLGCTWHDIALVNWDEEVIDEMRMYACRTIGVSMCCLTLLACTVTAFDHVIPQIIVCFLMVVFFMLIPLCGTFLYERLFSPIRI